jgi:hypothetical protein
LKENSAIAKTNKQNRNREFMVPGSQFMVHGRRVFEREGLSHSLFLPCHLNLLKLLKLTENSPAMNHEP